METPFFFAVRSLDDCAVLRSVRRGDATAFAIYRKSVFILFLNWAFCIPEQV